MATLDGGGWKLRKLPYFALLVQYKNILYRYNVFTSHGPDLYGTAPASFYLMNGLLNFNFAFPAALLVLPGRLAALALLGDKRAPMAGTRLSFLLSQVG